MTKETKDHYRLEAADTPKGELVGLFNNAGNTTEVAELVSRRRHEEALKGNTNIIENNSSGSSDKNKRGQQEKRDRERQRMLLQSFLAVKYAINDAIDLNNLETEQARIELEKAQSELQDTRDTISAMDDAIARIDNGEELETRDGKLANEKLEKVIAEFEEENGVTVNRDNTALLRNIIEKSQPKYRDKEDWQEKWTQLKQQIYDYHLGYGRDLDDLKKRADEADTPEEQEEIMKEWEDRKPQSEILRSDFETKEKALLTIKNETNQSSQPNNNTSAGYTPANAPSL